jgi:hypothetical protein
LRRAALQVDLQKRQLSANAAVAAARVTAARSDAERLSKWFRELRGENGLSGLRSALGRGASIVAHIFPEAAAADRTPMAALEREIGLLAVGREAAAAAAAAATRRGGAAAVARAEAAVAAAKPGVLREHGERALMRTRVATEAAAVEADAAVVAASRPRSSDERFARRAARAGARVAYTRAFARSEGAAYGAWDRTEALRIANLRNSNDSTKGKSLIWEKKYASKKLDNKRRSLPGAEVKRTLLATVPFRAAAAEAAEKRWSRTGREVVKLGSPRQWLGRERRAPRLDPPQA